MAWREGCAILGDSGMTVRCLEPFRAPATERCDSKGVSWLQHPGAMPAKHRRVPRLEVGAQ